MTQILDRVLPAARQLGASDVLSTLRTVDATEIGNRIIAMFPTDPQEAVERSTSPSDFARSFRGGSGGAHDDWPPRGTESQTGVPRHDEFEIEGFEN